MKIIYATPIRHQQMKNVSCVSSENVMHILQKVIELLFVHDLFHFIAFPFNIYIFHLITFDCQKNIQIRTGASVPKQKLFN